MKFTDSYLLDCLEDYVKKEPLVIWDSSRGIFEGGNLSGLAIGKNRSLRDALTVIANAAEKQDEGRGGDA